MKPSDILKARGLSAGYGKRPVVHGVDLTLRAGEALALVGPNAAGKSTLLRALTGQLPLHSGVVEIEGRPLTQLDPKERAQSLSLVPQSARFDLDFSVYEMVAFGRAPHRPGWAKETPQDRELIDKALAETQLGALAQRSFSELSGGERQRVLLARALAQNSQVMLLDEPTAHLDLSHQLLVIDKVLAHCQAGGAALVVLHDLVLAARLHRVAVLHAGRLVACDTPQKALSDERLKEIWKIDASLSFSEGWPTLLVRGESQA